MNKELLKLNKKKTNGPILKRAKDINRHLTKKTNKNKNNTQMADKHGKSFTSYVVGEMQIKKTPR